MSVNLFEQLSCAEAVDSRAWAAWLCLGSGVVPGVPVVPAVVLSN